MERANLLFCLKRRDDKSPPEWGCMMARPLIEFARRMRASLTPNGRSIAALATPLGHLGRGLGRLKKQHMTLAKTAMSPR